MDASVIKTSAIFRENPISPSCHAATLVETEQGLMAAWFSGTHEGHPDVAVWNARFENGAWSQPACLIDIAGVPLWNPVFFRDSNGKIWLFYKAGPNVPAWTGAYICSEDEGKT